MNYLKKQRETKIIFPPIPVVINLEYFEGRFRGRESVKDLLTKFLIFTKIAKAKCFQGMVW